MTIIRVHSLDHARAALTAARQLAAPVRLLSPEAAPGFAGIGWWRAMVDVLRAEFPDTVFTAVLDCGPSPGMALAAIRARVGPLRLNLEAAMAARIAGIAEQAEIRVECDGEETLDLLGAPDPGTLCRKALEKGLGDTEAGGAASGGGRRQPLGRGD